MFKAKIAFSAFERMSLSCGRAAKAQQDRFQQASLPVPWPHRRPRSPGELTSENGRQSPRCKRDIPPWCFLLAKAERAALSPSRIAAEMEMEDYSKVMVLGTRKVLFRVRNNRSVVVSTQYFSELRLRPSPRTSSSVALLPRRLNRPAARENPSRFPVLRTSLLWPHIPAPL